MRIRDIGNFICRGKGIPGVDSAWVVLSIRFALEQLCCDTLLPLLYILELFGLFNTYSDKDFIRLLRNDSIMFYLLIRKVFFNQKCETKLSFIPKEIISIHFSIITNSSLQTKLNKSLAYQVIYFQVPKKIPLRNHDKKSPPRLPQGTHAYVYLVA